MLSEAFARAAPAPYLKLPNLEERLQALWTRARETWPRLTMAPEPFMAHLAAKLPSSGQASEQLSAIAVEDLFLAWGCSVGNEKALAAFDNVLPKAGGALMRLTPKPDVDEVLQRLRKKLLVADGDQPARISEYAGRGSLVKWLQAAAIRDALTLSRSAHETPTEDAELADAAGSGQDPELDFIKERHRADFNKAFKEAFNSLTLRERTLLRMQHLDGLSIDALATMHGVHRSTVARWQAAARDALLKATRSSLMAHLRLSREEFDSMMRLIQSRLGPSLHSFFSKNSS